MLVEMLMEVFPSFTFPTQNLIILTECIRLGETYPSFLAKGRTNPPRQRSTCIQIPNCKANAAISYTHIHPSVISSCQESILHLTIYIPQASLTN
jgi:hypothetical protein